MLKFTENVKGHDLIQNQICLALQKNRLAHAVLFSGPTGVGKKKLAWDLAKTLLCENLSSSASSEESLLLWDKEDSNNKKNDFYPCGTCLSCRSINNKKNPHVLEVKTDTLQIKIQDLKPIVSFLSLQSFAKAKIIMMDSAEKMNSQASNFLLKTIEEPPPSSFFILISSQISQISLTIRSRVQNIGFTPLSESLIEELSPEGTEKWMIKSSRGQMNVLEDLRTQKELRALSFDFFFDCVTKQLPDVGLEEILKKRETALSILNFWRLFLRDLRLFSLSLEEEIINKDQQDKMKQLDLFSKTDLDFLIQKTLEMEYDLKSNKDVKLCFEDFIFSMKAILKGLNKNSKREN